MQSLPPRGHGQSPADSCATWKPGFLKTFHLKCFFFFTVLLLIITPLLHVTSTLYCITTFFIGHVTFQMALGNFTLFCIHVAGLGAQFQYLILAILVSVNELLLV